MGLLDESVEGCFSLYNGQRCHNKCNNGVCPGIPDNCCRSMTGFGGPVPAFDDYCEIPGVCNMAPSVGGYITDEEVGR